MDDLLVLGGWIGYAMWHATTARDDPTRFGGAAEQERISDAAPAA